MTSKPNQITIKLCRVELLSTLGLTAHAVSNDEEDPVSITAPFQHRKRGVESKLVLGINSKANPDPVLITGVAKARFWLEEIKNGKAVSQLASEEGRSIKIIQRQLELAFLSPRLIRKIVEGTQPSEMTSRQLRDVVLSADWTEQHRLFGIA